MNAIVLAILVMVILSLMRVSVVFALIAATLVGGLYAGMPIGEIMDAFNDGLGNGATVAISYAVLGAFGPAGDREFEVFNIAVDPEFQGRGLGRALLAEMLAVADAESAPVLLEVATGNTVARTLYEAHGFSVVGLRRNYYRPSGEDAYAMVRSAVIGGSEPRPGEPTAVPEEA